jgi:hypothetical protein
MLEAALADMVIGGVVDAFDAPFVSMATARISPL